MKREFSYGIIPLSRFENEWHVLIVQHAATHFAFPKGHAEKGETHQETAERELFEETGLKIKEYLPLPIIKEGYFLKRNEQLVKKEVAYFIAVTRGDVKIDGKEIIAFSWCNLIKAVEMLTFQTSKNSLKKVNELLTQIKI